MISGNQLRQAYLNYFQSRGHQILPSAPLVPENDPTTLFTGSGMQPMLPYLLGEPHPLGTRLVDSQKCFRAQDIEEVGDNRHDTFFEMLGNWSLGDYFKKEQQTWIWQFLTHELGLNPEHLYVSVFEGNADIPKDDEAAANWLQLGVHPSHIFYYGAKKNWWARSSYQDMPVGEPGGPSSEIFFEFVDVPHNPQFGPNCHPNCDCGRFVEIGNNVFMTYRKTSTGFELLKNKNIDFGGGFERILAAVNNQNDQFKTDIYWPIIQEIEKLSQKKYDSEFISNFRIIADHLKASVMLISDGVRPANKGQGYFLRRLIRRMAVKTRQIQAPLNFVPGIQAVFAIYWPLYLSDQPTVIEVISEEITKFQKTLDQGLKVLDTVSAFDLYQSYGFPIEIIRELYHQRHKDFDRLSFDNDRQKHQELSRTASKGMFKGGLQDDSETTTKYHTATHLLHASLRQVLGDHVQQKGSNITADRLRFDFSHPDKLTPQQIAQIEELINQKTIENLPVIRTQMPKSEALAQGALAFFPEKYPEVTSVYRIPNFSMELCGGPHVASTGEVGKIKIFKEESAGSGVRRIYARLAL